MKTFVIITLFATANLGTALFANPIEKPTPTVTVFKSQVAFHQTNVDALWKQYDLVVQRIRNSVGNHAVLERDEAFFVSVYQKDIDNNIRVEESRKALTEIKTQYARAHKKRSAEEARQIAALQNQLKKALKREAKALGKTKRTYADLANTQPMQEVENYVNESIERVDMLLAESSKTTIATQ